MKRLLTILTIVVCLIGCGDGVDRYEEKENKNVIAIIPYNSKNQIHGIAKEYKKEGKNRVLIQERSFQNGVENGWHRKYDHKVTIYEAFYKDGKREGEVKVWHNDGRKVGVAMFKNDEQDGEETTWHANGEVHEKLQFKNGKLDGTQVSFYDNNQIKSTSNYKDGGKTRCV